MPDVEENKTVDIDTSGPGAEIELEDNSTEENTSAEVETSAENTSTEVEAKEEQKEESKEKELEQYSESVQRRIAKLTHKWREAERQKEEAERFARAQIKLKEEAEQKISKLEPGFMKSTEDSIKSGLEAAKAQLAKAREAGDINAEVEAQALISEYGYKQARFAETKSKAEELAKSKETEVRTPEINLNRQTASQGTPDPKAEDWASRIRGIWKVNPTTIISWKKKSARDLLFSEFDEADNGCRIVVISREDIRRLIEEAGWLVVESVGLWATDNVDTLDEAFKLSQTYHGLKKCFPKSKVRMLAPVFFNINSRYHLVHAVKPIG